MSLPPDSNQNPEPGLSAIDAKPAVASVESPFQQSLAALAHELNNPLAAILGFSQLLLKKHWPPEDRAALDTINSEAIRCASIVHNRLVSRDQRAESNQAARAFDILLVADASLPDQAEVETFLSSRGHAVITASSGEMALRLANQTPFDVIICGEGLVTRDGIVVAATLRKSGRCANARFVTTLPRVSSAAPAAGDAAPTTTPHLDVAALRRLVEGD